MKQSLEEKQTLAMEGLAAGKNCGQLVLLAYQEELNLPEELIIPAFESHRIRYAEPPNPSGGAMRNQIPFRCSEPYPTMNLRQLCRTH